MASIDTNVLLRWLLHDVAEQADDVDRLFESGRRFVVDDAAIIETVFVLERVMGVSRETVAQTVRLLATTGCLMFDRVLWERVITAYVQHTKLSIADIYLATRAANRNATPLYTFDHKLAAQSPNAELVPHH